MMSPQGAVSVFRRPRLKSESGAPGGALSRGLDVGHPPERDGTEVITF